MKRFDSDGADLAYIDEGEREPVLLLHGFASNVVTNWVDTQWVRTLRQAGRRVIAFDHRGHGQSEKLYAPELYGAPVMAEDARRLLDHLGIASADIVGYSMGARVAAFFVFKFPDRVRSAIFAGLGINMVRGMVGTVRWRARSKLPASRTSQTTPRAASAPSPSRPRATSRRWPPACAARARRSR
jgi:pimeloyl-ACP methyl ester carboxylesterase